MFADTWWIWLGFNAFVIGMLFLDLGVFHRRAEAMSMHQALGWSGFWIGLALVFNCFLFLSWDWLFPANVYSARDAGFLFLTGYLVEKSLSVDNIFVIALIFSAFSVPAQYQRRVLFWGILGALIMRGTIILAGAALLHRFHWIIYVFGAFLLFTGVKMLLHKEEETFDPSKSRLIAFLRKMIPVTERYEKEKFFVKHKGKLMATPLLLVLALVEVTDLIFAVDSIPAIFAITRDPFIVYTSNVFAILGLRSLYFVLAGMMGRFTYLKPSLSAILVFVGVKMLLVDLYKIPASVSLGVIASLLSAGLMASWVVNRKADKAARQAALAGLDEPEPISTKELETKL